MIELELMPLSLSKLAADRNGYYLRLSNEPTIRDRSFRKFRLEHLGPIARIIERGALRRAADRSRLSELVTVGCPSLSQYAAGHPCLLGERGGWSEPAAIGTASREDVASHVASLSQVLLRPARLRA